MAERGGRRRRRSRRFTVCGDSRVWVAICAIAVASGCSPLVLRIASIAASSLAGELLRAAWRASVSPARITGAGGAPVRMSAWMWGGRGQRPLSASIWTAFERRRPSTISNRWPPATTRIGCSRPRWAISSISSRLGWACWNPTRRSSAMSALRIVGAAAGAAAVARSSLHLDHRHAGVRGGSDRVDVGAAGRVADDLDLRDWE